MAEEFSDIIQYASNTGKFSGDVTKGHSGLVGSNYVSARNKRKAEEDDLWAQEHEPLEQLPLGQRKGYDKFGQIYGADVIPREGDEFDENDQAIIYKPKYKYVDPVYANSQNIDYSKPHSDQTGFQEGVKDAYNARSNQGARNKIYNDALAQWQKSYSSRTQQQDGYTEHNYDEHGPVNRQVYFLEMNSNRDNELQAIQEMKKIDPKAAYSMKMYSDIADKGYFTRDGKNWQLSQGVKSWDGLDKNGNAANEDYTFNKINNGARFNVLTDPDKGTLNPDGSITYTKKSMTLQDIVRGQKQGVDGDNNGVSGEGNQHIPMDNAANPAQIADANDGGGVGNTGVGKVYLPAKMIPVDVPIPKVPDATGGNDVPKNFSVGYNSGPGGGFSTDSKGIYDLDFNKDTDTWLTKDWHKKKKKRKFVRRY